MAVSYRVQLSSQRIELGYVKVSDDSLIVVRVAIVNVRPAGGRGLSWCSTLPMQLSRPLGYGEPA